MNPLLSPPVAISRRQLHRLRQKTKQLGRQFNTEDIHRFRVAVKRTKALMRFAAGERLLKLKKPLRQCYRLTGELRNWQLHELATRDLCHQLQLTVPANYICRIHRHQKQLLANVRALRRKLLKNSDSFQVPHLPHHTAEGAIQDYLKKVKRTLAALMVQTPGDEALHSIRRQLKDLQYNWRILHKYMLLYLPADLADLDRVEQFTAALGDLHDLVVAQDFFTAALQANLPAPEQHVIETLLAHISTEKELLKADIITALQAVKLTNAVEFSEPALS